MQAKVTRRQKALVDNLLLGESRGNQTESAIRAGYGNGINRNTAKSVASDTLTKPNVVQYMNELMEELNLGNRVQLETIGSIMTGRAESETTIESADGSVTTYKRKPTHADRLKSIDLLAKLTGHYAKIRVEESVALDRYRELAKRLIDKPAQVESRRKPTKVHKAKPITEYVGICPVTRDNGSTIDADSEYVDMDDSVDGCGGEAV